MLILRYEQVQAFARADRGVLCDRVFAHVRRFFSAQCAETSDVELRARIRRGLERCDAHGFRAFWDVCRYIDLMVIFGDDFDRSESFPWAGRVLADPSLRDPHARFEALHAAALDELERLAATAG